MSDSNLPIPKGTLVVLNRARSQFKTNLHLDMYGLQAIFCGVAGLFAPVLAMKAEFSSKNSSPLKAVISTFLSTLIFPTLSSIVREKQLTAIETEKRNYDSYVSNAIARFKETARQEIEDKFVSDTNKTVKDGKQISFEDLAKLVNIDSEKFRTACNTLAITVLQAKAMLAIKNGDISHYNIANFTDKNLDPKIPCHHGYLLTDLWAQRDKTRHAIQSAKVTEALSKQEPDKIVEPHTPSIKVPLSEQLYELYFAFNIAASKALSQGNILSRSAKSVGSAAASTLNGLRMFYVDGGKGFWNVLTQSYNPDDHLPPTPLSIPAPEIKSVPIQELQDVIELWAPHIDLPALTPLPPK